MRNKIFIEKNFYLCSINRWKKFFIKYFLSDFCNIIKK